MIVAALAALLAGLLIGLAVRQAGARALRRENERQRREAEELRIRVAELETLQRADAEKLGWVEQAELKLREAFSALAGKALQDNAAMLSQRTQDDLKGVVEPLRERLATFGEHVRELEKNRQGAYDGLREQLRALGEGHSRLQETTQTLAQALRSPTVRGRWGELQLRRVVELAGMVHHVSFEEQAGGESGRPDMIVRLPNQGILPIDAKAPLDAYLTAAETQDPDARRAQLALHARALRDRVRDLSQKRYWEQFSPAPDFVVMFVPNEACLGAAFEADPALLEHAVQNRVLISSPVNLLALLRAVAYGWQQHELTDNARRLAAEGRDLHGRLSVFVGHFADLGERLERAVETYNKSVGSLERRLLPSLRRMQDLGVGPAEIKEPAAIEIRPIAPQRLDPPTANGSGGPPETQPPAPRSPEGPYAAQ